MNNLKDISDILIKRGNELLEKPYKLIEFTGNSRADLLLNNIKEYPHFFTLGCVMDSQIKADKAWLIPYKVSKEIRSIDFNDFKNTRLEKLKDIFSRNSLHRFNDKMAENFYLAIQKINDKYSGNASNIWKHTPSSATVVKRFLEFLGVGLKISTMTVNILARDFKVPLSDYYSIDISPDVQVKRVFKRIGFTNKNASNEILVYTARELNPEYPGIFDLSCWEIGRKWCRPKEPKCDSCYLNNICSKYIY